MRNALCLARVDRPNSMRCVQAVGGQVWHTRNSVDFFFQKAPQKPPTKKMFIIKRGANTVLKRIPEQVPQETGMQQSKREIRPDGHLQATKWESGESSKWRL